VLLQRIDYTVSGFRRVLFFYINHLGATLRVRGGTFSIRWSICCKRQYMVGKAKSEVSQVVNMFYFFPRRSMEPLWSLGAAIALLLLPLKSRSGGAGHLRILRRYTALILSHSYYYRSIKDGVKEL